jgi:integrase
MTSATLHAALTRAKQGDWATSAYGPKGIARAEYLVRYFEGLKKPLLTDIGSAELATLRKHFQDKGLAVSTINGYLSALCSLFTAARETPALTQYRPDINFIKNKQKRNRTLSDKEEAAMAAFFDDDVDMLDACYIALDIGLRESEFLRLIPLDCLDMDDAVAASVVVRQGKGDASAAAVSLTSRAAAILKRRCEGRGSMEKLFAGLSQRTLIRRWNAFRDHMGLMDDKGFTFHCTRHSTATRLIDEGVDVKIVQDFMRHEHITTTLKYVKNSARRTRGARSALENRKRELVDA